MRIDIVQANALTIEGCDALVVPTNKQLTLGWGSHVAEAVLAQAGRSVEQQALAQAPGGVKLGEVVLTEAGSMRNYKRLLHAATLDKWSMNPLFLLKLWERTSADTLVRATSNALQLAERAGLRSLVFTPMGAGIGGMRDKKCARLMLDAIRSPASSVQRVVIACPKTRTANVFRSML